MLKTWPQVAPLSGERLQYPTEPTPQRVAYDKAHQALLDAATACAELAKFGVPGADEISDAADVLFDRFESEVGEDVEPFRVMPREVLRALECIEARQRAERGAL